jgi:dihydropyrimidinase
VNGLACVHAENGDVIQVLRDSVNPSEDLSNGLLHERTRPTAQEAEAVTRTLTCAELSGARVLIFHISCDAAANVVGNAKSRGLSNVFGETCPQYLVFTDEKLTRPDARLWMCAPPLRPQADQDALWRKLATGVLDVVSSDHCPFTRAQKDLGKEDFRRVPNGMPGIETRLGLLHEFGVRKGRLSLNDWVRVCSTRPAELHGLRSKGRVAPGYDADLVIFDPAAEKKLSAETLHSALDYSVCEGITCTGWPRDVLLRGHMIVRDGQFTGNTGGGQFIKRSY